jgi:hypothetical protein
MLCCKRREGSIEKYWIYCGIALSTLGTQKIPANFIGATPSWQRCQGSTSLTCYRKQHLSYIMGSNQVRQNNSRDMDRGIGRSTSGRSNNFEQRRHRKSPETQQNLTRPLLGVVVPVLQALLGKSLTQRRAEIELARIRKQEPELAAARKERRATFKQGMVCHF